MARTLRLAALPLGPPELGYSGTPAVPTMTAVPSGFSIHSETLALVSLWPLALSVLAPLAMTVSSGHTMLVNLKSSFPRSYQPLPNRLSS